MNGSDNVLYVLTGIAIMFATMCTIYFTIRRQDRIWDRYMNRDNDDGSLRI